MQYEFRPRFKCDHIQYSTIIGSTTDYSPLYKILDLDIFKFNIHNGGYGTNDIFGRHIIPYFTSGKFTITIQAQITYNGQRFGINQVVNTMFIQDYPNYALDRLFDILIGMKQQLFQAMYDLSTYKVNLDIINHNLIDNIHSADMRPDLHEHYQRHLQDLEEQMNNEFERIFMAADGGAANDGITMTQSLRDFVDDEIETEEEKTQRLAEEEQEEYNRVMKYIDDGASTLRLNRKTIKKMSKDKTNKFILPLEANKEGDIDKFQQLTKQPFSFLTYNDSKFSVNLTTGIRTMWNEEDDESEWISVVENGKRIYNLIDKIVKEKKDKIIARQTKIGKAYHKLSDQIDYLKEQFEKKAERFPNGVYTKFIATRTSNNIKVVREAEAHAKRQLEVLKNKRLIKQPIAFFERAVTLFLGETGEDIIKDLYNLGYTSREDHEYAIKYLYFILHIVAKNDDQYKSPILAIMDLDDFNIGFKNSPILKVIAGHVFIHTVNIVKDYPETVQVEFKTDESNVSKYGTGSTGLR